MSLVAEGLIEKIDSRTARISVVGLGYVGLNVSLSLASEGFEVHGYDIDGSRIDKLLQGINYVQEEDHLSGILPLMLNTKFFPSTDVDNASEVGDIIIVIVPTAEGDIPTLDYLEMALDSITQNDIRGKLIILESTVQVGTSDEFVKPILERGGLKAGTDFFLAYSPERIDPGNTSMRLRNIPKVVGGVNQVSAEIAAKLYEAIVNSVVMVSSMKTAEFVKLMENAQRDVNIALVNLFAIMGEKAGIDIEEALFAASTKWNFHKYHPTCGVGGHCLKKDPVLLAKSFENTGIDLTLIESSRRINDYMPILTAEKAISICREHIKRDPSSVSFGILGLSYKKNSSDSRNSPALFIIERLKERGASDIRCYDPHVNLTIKQNTLKEVLDSNIVIQTVAHDSFKGLLDNYQGYVIDGTNTLDPSEKVIGIGRFPLRGAVGDNILEDHAREEKTAGMASSRE